jgi:Homeodomain-like domain
MIDRYHERSIPLGTRSGLCNGLVNQELLLRNGPDTLLAWYRRPVAQKFDGSKRRTDPGRPRFSAEIEALVVRLARENPGWGCDRIVGALANLGHSISDRTVGNLLRRHNIAPAPERRRKTTRKEFIQSHMDVLAGADFFTVEQRTGVACLVGEETGCARSRGVEELRSIRKMSDLAPL